MKENNLFIEIELEILETNIRCLVDDINDGHDCHSLVEICIDNIINEIIDQRNK